MRADSPKTDPIPRTPTAEGSEATQVTNAVIRSQVTVPTLEAPSFAPQIDALFIKPLQAGERIGDFELIRELGKGGYATVYLAKQLSLGRQVALKVGPNRGHEAQTLASLEHDHIIHVFSETIDPVRQVRLLCMQYVPGSTLQELMQELQIVFPVNVRAGGSGRDFLAALDRVSKHSEEFRPTALQERETLAQGDFYEAVCWIGAKLAGALEFAHQLGILHRDIKPANILINSYGRPFLADFNLATSQEPNTQDAFGGTLPYMAPEHLHAFATKKPDDMQKVDERADLYSLGVVLFELATGDRPYSLDDLLGDERQPVASLKHLRPEVPASLDAIIRTCLALNPQERYTSARQLREALEGCRHHLRSLREIPPEPTWTTLFHQRPFLSLLLLSLLPNLLGSFVNIAYNYIHIVDHLSSNQKRVFDLAVLFYNGLAYPVLVGITCWLLGRNHRDWQRIQRRELLDAETIRAIRGRVNFLATWSILGTSLGWLPGGLIFPLAIDWAAEHLAWQTFLHFIISFFISGLIAVTYCFLGTQYIVLRLLYPSLEATAHPAQAAADHELKNIPSRLSLFQTLAGVIPLSGALLLLLSGPVLHGDFWYRLLLSALILLGMFGFILALQICQFLQKVHRALTSRN